MRAVFRLAKWCSVAILIFSVGLHWAFLQSVAWVGMVATYAQHDSLPVAFSKTFDGKHPCKLCKVVAEGQNSEREKSSGPLEKLKKAGLEVSSLASALPAVEAPPLESLVFPHKENTTSRVHGPLSPPPRTA